ncbi:MAG: hypothetical protein H6828_11115 [Planctomycetes bacterium]|nr:hypothetical protein [Planctomycetota bacterium]
MKISSLACAGAAALLVTSCVSSPSAAHEHWSSRSVAPQMSRVLLGYDPDTDGEYLDYQWENKLHIAKTMQRHLLNWNPDNPFQPDDPDYYKPRPLHSPLPNPVNYFHVESMVIGACLFGAGAFVPVPVDSVIATLSPGGKEEFVEGLSVTFEPMRVVTASFLDVALMKESKHGEGCQAQVCCQERKN